jgi:hypothetical protein
MDIFRALGPDTLHFFDGGLWAKHIWPAILAYIVSEEGQKGLDELDWR